jgi:hypothetical protein
MDLEKITIELRALHLFKTPKGITYLSMRNVQI